MRYFSHTIKEFYATPFPEFNIFVKSLMLNTDSNTCTLTSHYYTSYIYQYYILENIIIYRIIYSNFPKMLTKLPVGYSHPHTLYGNLTHKLTWTPRNGSNVIYVFFCDGR